jgi:long-chain acyl-CoA synthetase
MEVGNMADWTARWLDNYPPGVAEHVEVPRTNLARYLEDAAKEYPDRPALHFEGKSISYRQLADQAWRFAGALRQLGVTKGTRVALILPNCPQAVVALFATLRLGAVVVQNNPLYTTRELAHQLDDSGSEVVVCLDLTYERVKAAREQVDSLREVIVTSVLDELPGIKRILAPYTKAGKAASAPVGRDEPVRRYREVLSSSPGPAPETEVDPETDLAMLQYTGGTTGVAKGVMLTHRNLLANTEQVREWIPDVEPGREVVMCVLPFFHVYGLTTCLNLGMRIAATLVLLPRFDANRVLQLTERFRPSLFPGAPTLYEALNRSAGDHDMSSIRACVSGAAPLRQHTVEEFERRTGGRLVEGYGLTEASPVTHANPIYGKRKVGTIGLPIPDTIARVTDPADPGKTLEMGEVGELAIKGPQVMQGYWNQPDETAKVLVDGWLLTGDMARMDDEGYFEIVDRRKEMVIVSGFNVYPTEVEDVMFTHPKVADVAVAGVPDTYRGEIVKAYVVLEKGEQATVEELLEFAGERLARYKVPREIDFRDDLPKTMIGKVLRRELVEEEKAKEAAATPAQEG